MANSKLTTDTHRKPATSWLRLWAPGFANRRFWRDEKVSRATINRWMDEHEEFRDAVSMGKAARVFGLERQMLASKNTALINACRSALSNAAGERHQ